MCANDLKRPGVQRAHRLSAPPRGICAKPKSVVLATFLDALGADDRLIVVKDCCADADPEVHRCLVERVFPCLAGVATAEEVIDAMG